MVGVLFVCTGNICRSPTAEAVFRHFVEREGLKKKIRIDSAGISDYHEGDSPDSRTIICAEKRGFVIDGLIARRVIPSDYEKFDYLLAMDRSHLHELAARGKRLKADVAPHRVRLFMEFAPAFPAQEVPDPYYGGARGFEDVLDMIEAGCRGLLDDIRQNHF